MFLTNFSNKNDKKIVLALGYFDCLHIGHQKLLQETKKIANDLNVLSAVFTFSNNLGGLIKKKNKLINTFTERLTLFENFGMDAVMYAEFNKDFMSQSADRFLELLKQKNVVGVVCGYDYTFGKNSVGTAETLRQFCKENKIVFSMVDKVDYDGKKASATRIKELLIDGEIEKANQCLGHEYFMSGAVCHGFGIGSKEVYPTANLKIPQDKLYPKLGVYAGKVSISNTLYPCVINVGGRPTFEDDETKIEVNILKYDGNIYDKEITVYFCKYLREIKKFGSAEELKQQISKDIRIAELCVK